MLVTSETSTLPLALETSAREAVRSSLSIVDPAPVSVPTAVPQVPAPSPSDVHTCPLVPAEVIKYSLFSTLLAVKVPSARSAKSSS